MPTFQNSLLIPLFISKLNCLISFKKKQFFNASILKNDNKLFESSKYSQNLSNKNELFNSTICKTHLNPLLVNCEPSKITFEQFKNDIQKVLNTLENGNKLSILENQKNVKINMNIKNKKDLVSRITRFLNIINENSSLFQNSTIFNDWKFYESSLGKKIQIVCNNSDENETRINIYIPNDKNLDIEVEYIKSIDALFKRDLDAICVLIGSFQVQDAELRTIFQKDNSRFNHTFSRLNSRLFEISPMEYEFFQQIESFINDFNQSDHFTNLLNTNQIEEIYPKKMERFIANMFPDFNIDSFEKKPLPINKNKVVSALEDLGVQVYMNDEENNKENENPWEFIGGYEEVKNQIEEHILLHLKHPDILDKIVHGTRAQKDSSNRPKLILFEGPPGTGKTTSARIIGSVVKIPLIYVSLENIVSKWYGESETRLAQIFDLARKFKQGCIIFIDEIDTMASSRDKTYTMHEGSKKILSVLLRKLDGFDTVESKTLLICATNRRKDLDDAFINRIDSTVYFPLPNEKERELIFKQYAKHLKPEERTELAKMTKKFSGRSIRHICLEAEREWASEIIKNKETNNNTNNIELPAFKIYKEAVKKRCV